MIKLNYKMGRYVMNEKYRVNSVDFEEYKKKFESKVSDFRQDLFDVFMLNNNVKWEGTGHNAFNSLIIQKIDKLNYIPQILDLYVDIMDRAINDFSEGQELIKKQFEEILELIRLEKAKRGDIDGD